MVSVPEVKIFSDPLKLMKAVAAGLYLFTQESAQPRFDIALSGGKTPELLFRRLAVAGAGEMDWSRLHFWWSDERCVPPDHLDSNFRLANSEFFEKINIQAGNLHRIMGENNPEDEAARYSAEVREHLNLRGNWPVFDLILLGLGEDGHTASIFPENIELMNSDRICEVAVHPLTGQKRITLTGKVINNASRLFFIVTGANKALRIKEIMNNEPVAVSYPAYHVAPVNGSLIWFLDKEATGQIT